MLEWSMKPQSLENRKKGRRKTPCRKNGRESRRSRNNITQDDIITETVDKKVVREEANVGGTGMSMNDMRQLAGLDKKIIPV